MLQSSTSASMIELASRTALETHPDGGSLTGIAEAELESLERALTNHRGIALVHARLDGSIVDANEAFARLNRACGGGSSVCIPGFVVAARRLAADRQPLCEAVTLVLDAGARRLQAQYVPVLGALNDVTGIAALFQDWTVEFSGAQTAAVEHARARDFARAAADWFWETDAAGNLTSLSANLAALLGTVPAALIGQALETIGTMMPGVAGDMPMRLARAAQAPFRQQLFAVQPAGAEPLLYHLSGVPTHNPFGQFSGYRGAASDVTRHWRIEEEARHSRNTLERAMAALRTKHIELDLAAAQTTAALNARTEFLAAMSHELRTPLNAIIGFADAMATQVFGTLDERYVGYAQDIRQAGNHLLGLINDVLDVSVIDAGEVALDLHPIEVSGLVARARTLIELRAGARHIDIGEVLVEEPLRVLGDDRRCIQILVNLLGNAVKFTPEGGRIGLEAGESDGDMVALTVRDSGPGIAPADHERVFEKFQQLASSPWQGKPEGAGLGLHISRELARRMGGDLRLSSLPGQGARFTLLLPAAR